MTAASNKIVSGRYIFQPEVMRVLETQGKGAGGEIQLTDAMARMIGIPPFNAVTFAGRRFDCGSKLGFVEATLALALERSDMWAEVCAMAERLLADMPKVLPVPHVSLQEVGASESSGTIRSQFGTWPP